MKARYKPDHTYAAVIVGARCAGAALATYLARAGASAIVLEADPLGTDQVISTHTIHPAGVDILDELGVGAAVLEGSPPARVIRFQADGAYADIEPPEGRFECCPRRYRLDRLLQEAAVEAGAEVHGKSRVIGLLWEDERVVGVRARQADREIEIRGTVTVGADGRRSTVAQLVGAEEYLGYDAPRAMYWAYWDPPPSWNGPVYPYDVLLFAICDELGATRTKFPKSFAIRSPNRKSKGVLPKSFGSCLGLVTQLSCPADPIPRQGATVAKELKTKKTFAFSAAWREIGQPRLHV